VNLLIWGIAEIDVGILSMWEKLYYAYF